jgi:aminoglycoside phosphotransferase (APT) family kinase protein
VPRVPSAEPMSRADDATELQRSSRDLEQVRRRLEAWLGCRLPDGARPEVKDLRATSANGMSSETLLFDASWSEGDRVRTEEMVARVAPGDDDVPVFPVYDLERQFRAMQKVAELTVVPVPTVWWYEPDPAAIGSPFFVMSRVHGAVPPDVLPYNFGDSWLFSMSPREQRELQDATVGLLAGLHAVPRPEEEFAFLALDQPGASPLRRHVAKTREWYEFAAADVGRSSLVEQGFHWLEAHWPATEGPAVLSWGDSRIGNVMYRGTRPVAAFDWEMAALGPRELDVAWLVWAHRNFEDLTAEMALPGMPDFLRPEDVVATYRELTAYELCDMEFYLAYSAVQFGIVYLRTGRRSVHFGERAMPEDPDELLINRRPLERVVTDRYWG